MKRILIGLLMLAASGVLLLALASGASANDKGKPTPTEGPKATATPGEPKPTETPGEPKPTNTPEPPKPTNTPEEPKPTATPKPPHDPKDDLDQDGCTTEEEIGPNEILGGRRDPKNHWDLYDVNGDKAVNLANDILGVAAGFGSSSGMKYAPELDRRPPPSAQQEPDATKREPWDMGPPDGVISVVDDILGAAKQFGTECK